MAKLRPLPKELATIARFELNEVEDILPNHIKYIQNWIENYPNFTARTNDQFLVGFLRFCKHDLEKTKQRLQCYYKYKSTVDGQLKFGIVDEKLLNICNSGITVALPKPAGRGGPCIHVTRMNLIDTSLYTVCDVFRFHTVRAEIEINTNDNWVVSGVLEIIDCSKIPFGLLRQFDVSTYKKMAAFLEDGVPTTLQGTHIVNASREVKFVLRIVRSLMHQKDLLHIHNNIESLQCAIGKEYLPCEYGGQNGTLSHAVTLQTKQLTKFKQYFEDDEQYGYKAKCRCPVKLRSETRT